MRILIAVPHYHPAIGGVENYSRAVAKSLQAAGHRVLIVTTLTPHSKPVDRIDGIKTVRLPVWMRLSNTPINPLWYFHFKKIIRHFRPHVIHAHSPVPFFADMCLLAANGRPTLLTYHAGSMAKGTGAIDRVINTYEKYILPRTFRRASAIGAVLPSFAKALVKNEESVTFTPPGIDTSFYVPAPEAVRTTDVLFAGRIEKTSAWKGLDVLIEALAIIQKTKPRVRVQIIGDGDALDDYRQQVKDLGLDETVEFTGALDAEQLRQHYQTAKVVVLPSKTQAESFGMVLAEAMACAAAVIGSRIGGIPNLIRDGETGLLAQAGNAPDLADKIIKLLDDPDCAEKLGKNASTHIKQHFSLEAMITTNQQLLDNIAKPELVHITAHFPPHLGGMEQAVQMLTDKLHEKGHTIRIITSSLGAANEPAIDSRRKGLAIQRLPARIVANTPVLLGLFTTLMRRPSTATFHVHVAQAGIPEVAFLAAKIKRIPLVMHLHGDVEASTRAGILLPLYKKIFLGFVLRHADAVIVPTASYKTSLSARYRLRNPVHVIPAGIDDAFFSAPPPTKDHGNLFTLLYVGRLSIEKNVPLLLEAISTIATPLRFVIIGDGPLRTDLEKQAEKTRQAGHQIELIGRKPAETVRTYYQQADAFVLASNYESQSLATIEAMASGTPVIVADVAAVNEIVRGAGVLTDKTPEAFRIAIERLMSDKEYYAQLQQSGTERAKQFNWSQLTSRFEEVYEAHQ